jgi:hypothetical protein
MPSSDERGHEKQPWDDPEVMTADLRRAIRDIEASGGKALAEEDLEALSLEARNDTPTVHYVHDSDGAGARSDLSLTWRKREA